ncbi:hypothetical protein [Macrococcus capreoli]|uniref:hypothetical protein n=1 Tax=Macrococcus capreoli TaxID=2982690 RepID=UPI0021D5EEF4|nr:hypothetical protein [Macrococcus sp. TMW 2.2395]MCU7557293.1 hypothetical protein [Macrococcus sp. TMW 2.2395]
MKTKTLLSGLAISTLLLTACNNEAPKKEETKKVESKKEDKSKEAKDKIKKQKEKVTTEAPTTEAPTTEVPTTEKPTTEAATTQQAQNININNITDRATLEAVVYGNYSEMDKITAYKSAVANGVIPQGNVMEGPASKAYESSLRVESGQEKSMYTTNPNPGNKNYDHLYNSSNATDNIDPNYSPDNANKSAQGGLTSGEIQTKYAIEQGYYDGPNAQEVYNAIVAKEQALQNK